MEKYKPARGDLAYCEKGKLGIILESRISHGDDGEIYTLYKGIYAKAPCGNWQSINPKYCGKLDDAVSKLLVDNALEEFTKQIDENWILEGKFG